ncbi:MAG: hypothetical protein GF355_13595, partial [Candidatus Eisenbacteria bacterium]|nr:hypothetical protein [Candidatus Eisenbacteria bacterium]
MFRARRLRLPATALFCFLAAAPAMAVQGWLGIYTEPAAELPAVEASAGGSQALHGARSGLRVAAVFPDSPAAEGGLLVNDIIIAAGGHTFTCPAESVRAVFNRLLDGRPIKSPFPLRVIRDAVTRRLQLNRDILPPETARRWWRRADEWSASLASGDTLQARVAKQQVVRHLPVVLGPRPEAHWPAPPPNRRIYRPGRFTRSSLAGRFWSLAGAAGVTRETRDLLRRLTACHRHADPFRMEAMIYVHRDPFRLESVSRRIARTVSAARHGGEALQNLTDLWIPGAGVALPATRRLVAPNPPVSRGARTAALESLIQQIEAVLGEARLWHRRAFARLTDSERGFLEANRWRLSDVFAEEVYIHFDEDQERFEANKRLLDLAQRVDWGALMESARRAALLTEPRWARAAGDLLREVYADSLETPLLLERMTEAGRILFGGTTRAWYRQTDAAFILDLGGDDFYTGNNGGGRAWSVPVAVCIDLAGDDAYESTLKAVQGSGCLGIGGLLDLAGDDQYIGNQWCQGTAYLGIGWLHDAAGDDVYRGRTFCQGAGLFGIGLLIDGDGDDRYEGDGHVQALGLAKGIGALVDAAGDDTYYAKGLYPTGYGDAGIFDSWSQGCGMGFRTLASGGLGILTDGGGR